MIFDKVRANFGFTLVELLIVIAILGVLMGLLLPAVQRVREAAAQSSCRNNLRQIGIAAQGFHNIKGHLPPGYLFDENYAFPEEFEVLTHTSPGWGWAAFLLPHLDQGPLAQQIRWEKAVEDSANDQSRRFVLPVFVCPSDSNTGVYTVLSQYNEPMGEAATNSYAACYGYGGRIGEYPTSGNGLFYRNSQTRHADIRDGLSTTLAVGERAALFVQGPWAGAMTNGTIRTQSGAPGFVAAIEESPVMILARTNQNKLNNDFSVVYDFFSPHPTSGMFLFADGTVRSMSFATAPAVWQAIGTRAGGEVISESDF